MAISIQCPGCGSSLQVRESLAGKRGKCPKCTGVINVPLASVEPPPLPLRERSPDTPAPGLPVSSEAQPYRAILANRVIAALTSLRGACRGVGALRSYLWTAAAAIVIISVTLIAIILGTGKHSHGQPSQVASDRQLNRLETEATDLKQEPANERLAAEASKPTTPVSTGKEEPESKRSAVAVPVPDGRQKQIADQLPDLIEQIEGAVVRIDNSTGTGSGFLVENDVTVVTNYHVVSDAQDARVTFKNGASSKVLGFVALLPDKDLAILRIAPLVVLYAPDWMLKSLNNPGTLLLMLDHSENEAIIPEGQYKTKYPKGNYDRYKQTRMFVQQNAKALKAGTAVLPISASAPAKNGHKPLKLATVLPRNGERVVAFGTPEGLSFSSSDGIISAIRSGSDLKKALRDDSGRDLYTDMGYDTGITWVQTTAPISHGSSGGPLVNMQGEVVGVNTLLQPLGHNLAFAVSACEVSAVLKRGDLPFAPSKEVQKPPSQVRVVGSKGALKRIRRFHVVVNKLMPDAVAAGLREGDVRALVENRLRNAGIAVTERIEKQSDATLFVYVGTLLWNVQYGSIGHDSFLKVQQWVSLSGLSPQQVDMLMADTWQGSANIGFCGTGIFATEILQVVGNHVDEFVTEYAKARNQ